MPIRSHTFETLFDPDDVGPLTAREEVQHALNRVRRGIEIRFADADLQYLNLSGLDFSGLDMRGADLSGADLRWARFDGTMLQGALLYRADASWSDFRRADLRHAQVHGVTFREATLTDADLRGAEIRACEFEDAKVSGWRLDADSAARFAIVPEGELIGWKRTRHGIVKLLIPANARRSNGAGRKCRAEFAKVLELPTGVREARSLHDESFAYRAGAAVRAHAWDPNRWNECTGGIHFYLTREEAVAN